MARSRNIKPGLFQNEVLAECDPLARYLFAGLWTLADREGRIEDRPLKIKGQLLPFDNTDIGCLLDQLAVRGFVRRYEVDGRKCIDIPNFVKHQSPHPKEPASELPAFSQEKPCKDTAEPGKEISCSVQIPFPSSSLIPDSPIPHPSNLNPENKERASKARSTSISASSEFELFWKTYPRKEGKKAAAAKWKSAVGDIMGTGLDRPAAVAKLQDACRIFADSPKGRSGDFCPHAKTWLNEGRYLDDPAEWQKSGGTNGNARQNGRPTRPRVNGDI